MIDYRSGLWNDWTGGYAPVKDGDLVEFLTFYHVEKNREADIVSGFNLAGGFEWIGDEFDIVKFRVIKKAEEV